MGYEVHVTRKENWFAPEGPLISLEEWIQFAQSDPEMRLDGFAEAATSKGDRIGVQDPRLCVWTTYSKNGQNGNEAWLWLSGGNIIAKNPDDEILRKMYAVAQRPSAKVQGDEGECYGPDGEPVSGAPERRSPGLLKRWFRRG